MTMHVSLRSFKRGLLVMEKGEEFFKPKYWTVKFRTIQEPWICLWTPSWHNKRGPYVSIGILFIAVYRGY